jgi:hypothetical protein
MSGPLGTYVAFLVCLGAAALAGSVILMACGRRRWSRLAPAVGLAALCPVAWGTVQLGGHGTTAIIAIAVVAAGSALYVLPRVEGLRGALRNGLPLELAAVVAASLPFIVEQRFGILGTGLNPDMSQHLLAASQLASGGTERLIDAGYPLGPHSIAVAVSALGPNLVQAFNGLQVAIAVATCLVGLGALEHLAASRRIAGALLVGFAYLLASTYVQGSFKEALEALFLIAFAVGLGELAADWPLARRPGPRALRAVPLAVLGIGALYAYSFPGLVWLAGALGVWAVVELAFAARAGGLVRVRSGVRQAAPAALVAIAVLAAVAAPEIGRMLDFGSFETFNPVGSGLGNLFNRLSPLEALGIWPSGDFRVEPGDGAVPAVVFYLGAALAVGALAFGLRWWWRERERAVPAALGAAAGLWLYALVAGTPYQEAKALVLIAPLAMLIAVRALLERAPTVAEARRILGRRAIAYAFPGRARVAKLRLAGGVATVAFLLGAGISSGLALVNGPVGPSGYSPVLTALRTELPPGSTMVVAPRELLADQHGADWIAWELRGNRICVVEEGQPPLPGTSATLRVELEDGAVVPIAPERSEVAAGPGPCPPIPDAARADPSAGG